MSTDATKSSGPDEGIMVLQHKESPDSHNVPADVLASSLGAVQDLVFVLAAAERGGKPPAKFKKTHSFKEAHRLYCSVPIHGSYAIPISRRPSAPTLTDDPVLHRLLGLVHSLSSGEGISIPDGLDLQWETRIWDALLSVIPRADSPWRLAFGSRREGAPPPSFIPDSARDLVEEARDASATTDDGSRLIGTLLAVDFKKQKFCIEYPLSKRRVWGSYPKRLEDDLWRLRLDLVFVDGVVKLGGDGTPKEFSKVTGVSQVDTSPVVVSSFSDSNGITHELVEHIAVLVELDELTKQVYVGSYEPLMLRSYAETRAELRREIQEELSFLWSTYVISPPGPLSPKAVELAAILKRLVAGGSDVA